jgi:hypothetical protein
MYVIVKCGGIVGEAGTKQQFLFKYLFIVSCNILHHLSQDLFSANIHENLENVVSFSRNLT